MIWVWKPETRGEKACMAIIWGAVLFSLLTNFAVSAARADGPEGPVKYEVEQLETGCEDLDAAAEQYTEVIGPAGLCAVLVERLDQVGLLLDDQRIRQRLVEIRDLVDAGEVKIVNGEPVAVSESEPVSLEMTEEAVTAAGMAQREAIWAFAGLAVALFAGYALYRQVMPRG